MLAATAGLYDEGFCALLALPVVTTSFIRYSNNDLAQMLTTARSVVMPNEGGVFWPDDAGSQHRFLFSLPLL